jgi:hypothetical protein
VHETSMPEAMSSADLVKELTSNAQLLVQRQVKMATLEAKQELAKSKTTAELVGSGGLFAYAGFIMLLMAAAMAIGSALDGRYWAGALIVAAPLLVLGSTLGSIGWGKRPKNLLPRTRAELKKEISWARYRTT